MTYRILFVFISLSLLARCTPDEEVVIEVPLPANPELECNEENIVGEWYVLDSTATIYHDLDSTYRRTAYRQMYMDMDGSGHIDLGELNGYSFLWTLQCDSAILTINDIDYDLISNKLDYKKLWSEGYHAPLNLSFSTGRTLFRKR